MASLKIEGRKEELETFVRWPDHLRRVDRFHLPEDDEQLIERIVDYSIKHRPNDRGMDRPLYRVRINEIDKRTAKPSSKMVAPPYPLARPGRMNPLGITYLYVALEQATAIAEVLPWVHYFLWLAWYLKEPCAW